MHLTLDRVKAQVFGESTKLPTAKTKKQQLSVLLPR